MLAFLQKYLLQAIILAAITGTAAGWLKGLASSTLPGTEAPRCWIEERWQAAFGSSPGPDPGHFTVLLTRLAGDPDGSLSAHLEGALRGERGIHRLETCRVVALQGGVRTAAEQPAEAEAEGLRATRGADLVLWGEVTGRGGTSPQEIRVWINGPTVRADLKAKPWVVDKDALAPAFKERFSTALEAIVLAALAPAQTYGGGNAVADLLRPLLPRLNNLVSDLPDFLTPNTKATLLSSAGWGFLVYGEQAGHSESLHQSVRAYREALKN